MRFNFLGLAALLAVAVPATAQTADDIIARYITRVGGADRIHATTSIRRTGRLIGGGGFEAVVTQENRRPNLVREEYSLQGMTAINAWDGTTGWKIDPFGGKKDAEALSEEEMHGILLDADFDDPLIDYAAKGSKVEFVGMDQVEGTDVFKLRLTLANGDVRTYFMDADSYVPIRMEEIRLIRGAEQRLETTLGDYKSVNGWVLPFSIENGMKGREPFTVHYEKIEVNAPLDARRFAKPGVPPTPGSREEED